MSKGKYAGVQLQNLSLAQAKSKKVVSTTSLLDMFNAGVHLGAKTRYWNPKMKSYIFGARDKVHIINLERTVPMFNEALAFLSGVSAKDGKVLFVGTKKAARDAIKNAANKCDQFYVDHRWLGGFLVNWKTVRQSIKRLKDLEAQNTDGTFDTLSKKQALMLTREMEKLQKSLGGIKNMGGLPDALFVIDPDHEHMAIKEANNLGIPIVAVVDTNSNPDGIDFIVPGNDDSIRAISLYTDSAANAIIEGREQSSSTYIQKDSIIEETDLAFFRKEFNNIESPSLIKFDEKKSALVDKTTTPLHYFRLRSWSNSKLNEFLNIDSNQILSLSAEQLEYLSEYAITKPVHCKFSLIAPINVSDFEALLEEVSELSFRLTFSHFDNKTIKEDDIGIVGIHLNSGSILSFGRDLKLFESNVDINPKYMDFVDPSSNMNYIDTDKSIVTKFEVSVLVFGVML